MALLGLFYHSVKGGGMLSRVLVPKMLGIELG